MKKIVLFIWAIIAPMVLMAGGDSKDVVIDGIKYHVEYSIEMGAMLQQVYVIANPEHEYSGDIVIPSSITGVYSEQELESFQKDPIYKDFNFTYFSVTGIASDAFVDCSEITSIMIPNNYLQIYGSNSRNPFSGCTKLNTFKYSETPEYDVYNAFITGKTLIRGCNTTQIPDFITRIGAYAFEGCTELTTISLPHNAPMAPEDFYGFMIGEYAFSGCSNLSSITFPDGLFGLGIGANAFSGCSNLTSVTFPEIKYDEGVSLGKNAFENCTNLHIVTFSNSRYKIGESCFVGCGISDVYCYTETPPYTDNHQIFDESIMNATLHNYDYTIELYKENDAWNKFGQYVPFEIVTDFTLTYYVEGEEYKTEKHKYGDEIIPEEYPVKEGYTFSGWEGLPKIMPGKDLKVEGVFIRNDVKENGVLYWCLNDNAVVLGNDNASGEVSIESSVTFNEKQYTVTEIMENSFSGCKGITSIEIPSTIINIGERAFANIDKLNDVTCHAEAIPTTDRTAFENSYTEDYVTLHVPGESIENYKEVAPWKNFKEIVAIAGTEVAQTYKLTYMVDGEEYKVVEINEGDSITPEAIPTKEGYTFSGWGDIPDVMPSQDVTVSGTFTVNKYKLVYIIDGEEYKTIEVEYGSAITPEAYPEREGYTFSGWDNVPETMPAGNVTVTGYFTVNKYTITYYVDGEVYKTVEVEYGSEISAEEEPTKEGYDFSGWSWIPSKMPAEDVTVTGSFTKASYEVDGATYQIDENGATLTSVDNATGDVVLDATVTINGKTYRITVIGEGAFQGNDRITSLTVPDGIEVIMQNAFDGCSKLMKLMLGKNVRYIGSKAFAGIGKAAARTRADAEPLTIECYAESVPQADSDCFEGVDVASAILKVNDELTGGYKTTTPWNQFGSILGFNEAASVGSIFTDEEGAEIYSIDGRRVEGMKRGVYILKGRKGVKKVVGK